MGQAVDRFAPYAVSGVPAFGGDSAPFGGLDPFNLSGMTTFNTFPYQVFGGFDSATTASASASSAASAVEVGTEVRSTPYTRIDPDVLGGGLVGIQTEWGSDGTTLGRISQTGPVRSRNGSGGAATLDTAGSGTPEHTGPSIIHANARRRRLSSSAGTAHVVGSAPARTGIGSIRPRVEEARAWARPGVLPSSASCPFLER